VTPSALTVGGLATARFTATGGGGVATVSVACDNAIDQVQVEISSDSPGVIIADPDTAWIAVGETWESSQALITAHVLDSYMNPVDDGTDVVFSIVYGPGGGEYLDQPGYGYGPVIKQTSGGMASVTVNSGTKAGTVLMTISSGDHVSTAVKVGIASGAPDSIFITVGHIVQTMGCVYVQAVSALVRDRYNNPVENGTAVYFTMDRPDVGFINPETYTGGIYPCLELEAIPNKGVAYACMKYPTSSMNKAVTITASCGGIESSFPMSVFMVEPISVNVEALPNSVNGTEGDSVTVYVTVNDECALPIAGGYITYVVDGDGYVDPPTTVTDEYGFCTTTLVIPPETGEGTTTVKARLWMTEAEGETEVNISP
jgi:hypothetical protein